MEGPLVVIGVGNILLRDDGVGVRAVEQLRAVVHEDPSAVPPDTRILDGGTALLGLLQELEHARGLVLVDATAFGPPAGSVTVRTGEQAVADGGPAHGITDFLFTARLLGCRPDEVSVVGVEVAEIDFGTDVSAPVALALPEAVMAVRRELWRMNDQVEARGAPVGAAGRSAGAMA